MAGVIGGLTGFVLGLSLGLIALAFGQAPMPGTAPSPCDTQIQLVEYSRKQVETVAAQTISGLQGEIAKLQKQVAEAAKLPAPPAKPAVPEAPKK